MSLGIQSNPLSQVTRASLGRQAICLRLALIPKDNQLTPSCCIIGEVDQTMFQLYGFNSGFGLGHYMKRYPEIMQYIVGKSTLWVDDCWARIRSGANNTKEEPSLKVASYSIGLPRSIGTFSIHPSWNGRHSPKPFTANQCCQFCTGHTASCNQSKSGRASWSQTYHGWLPQNQLILDRLQTHQMITPLITPLIFFHCVLETKIAAWRCFKQVFWLFSI